METRDELIAIVGERYRSAGRAARSRMLDEFVATTGYHRKHAIRLLARPAAPGSPRRRSRPRQYGEDVREALVVLWEASDRICSKRLRPLIPVLLPALERHGKLTLGEEVRARLLAISSATIDRALVDVRVAAGAGRARRAGFTSAVRRAVPIRTFADWGSPEPGFVEADFVAHGGASSSGSFIQKLVLTDVATGWTECIPVLRLAAAAPDRFSALQLRTVQRTVKRWRGELVQQVLRGEMQPLALAAPAATGAASATSSALRERLPGNTVT